MAERFRMLKAGFNPARHFPPPPNVGEAGTGHSGFPLIPQPE